MYRLMLYFLISLAVINILLSFLKVLPYNFIDILLSGIYLTAICNLANYIFSKLVRARTNLESASISALILTLIIRPLPFLENILTLTLIGLLAMASKYVFTLRKKHIFNPAAASVFISALILKTGASWWVGGSFTLPFIILGGLLVLTKIKRAELVISFLLIYFLFIFLSRGLLVSAFTAPSIWFFALVMLVEPLTSPSTKKLQVLFGVFVALVYLFGYSLETALLAGNLFTLVVSPSFNVVLEFRKKEKVAKNTWSFYFEPMSRLKFTPGQYMEWTYPHKNADARGIRRYFTLSSSPAEKYVAVTMRVTQKGSSFKKAFLKMQNGEQIMASSPQGEFVLPKDENALLGFIAGGIGATPFRSMIKFLLENNQKRNIVLLYSNNTPEDTAFKEMFEKAKRAGVETHYIITQKDGYIDQKLIKEKVSDLQARIFYVSGPQLMVGAFRKMLSAMKVKNIKTDYFPGYANTNS